MSATVRAWVSQPPAARGRPHHEARPQWSSERGYNLLCTPETPPLPRLSSTPYLALLQSLSPQPLTLRGATLLGPKLVRELG